MGHSRLCLADNSLVFGNLLFRAANISSSDDNIISSLAFFFCCCSFFCWSFVLIFTSLWNYSTMQTSTHTYRAFLCAFVCIVSVAVPIQLNHHAKDSTSPQTKWFPDDSLSFSKSPCLPSSWVKNRREMCYVCDWYGLRQYKTWDKSEEPPRSSCLCQPTI